MATNSDLTPVQNAGSTGNPQTVEGAVGTTDPSTFQQSAGVDSLDQNHSISVVQTGRPVSARSTQGNSSGLMWVFIIISSVLLIVTAIAVFKWVMKRQEPIKDTILKENNNQKIVKKVKTTKTTKTVKAEPQNVKPTVAIPRGKKKLPRSKRNKR